MRRQASLNNEPAAGQLRLGARAGLAKGPASEAVTITVTVGGGHQLAFEQPDGLADLLHTSRSARD